MSEAYIGQIEIFAFPFAPKNWQLCAGAILSIQQNAALFSLLGTTYGGNGVNTFALPDMRGRAPISMGKSGNPILGEVGGEETHTLITGEIPPHTHMIAADGKTATTSNKNTPDPTEILGITGGMTPDSKALQINLYFPGTPSTTLAPGTITNYGSGQPHENRMPMLVLNFCICVNGLFPSRN